MWPLTENFSFLRNHMSFLSSIDSVLDNENATLCEVLDTGEAVSEYRFGNKRLIDKLRQPEWVDSMVQLVLSNPDPNKPNEVDFRRYQYAADLLASAAPDLYPTLFSQPKQLDLLFDCLFSPEEISPLTGCYIRNIFVALCQLDDAPMLDYFIGRGQDFVFSLVACIDRSAVVDLLFHLVRLAELPSADNAVLRLLFESDIVDLLFNVFSAATSDDENAISCSVQILAGLLSVTRSFYANNPSNVASMELLEALESRSLIERLLNCALAGDESLTSEVLVMGFRVNATLFYLRCLVEPATNIEVGPDLPPLPCSSPISIKMMAASGEWQESILVTERIVQLLLPFFNSLVSFVFQPLQKQHDSSTLSSSGSTTLAEPVALGSTRLHILRFLRLLFERSNANLALVLSLAQLNNNNYSLDMPPPSPGSFKSANEATPHHHHNGSLLQAFLVNNNNTASQGNASVRMLGKLHQIGFLAQLMDLAMEFRWNTFLHGTVDSFLKFFSRQIATVAQEAANAANDQRHSSFASSARSSVKCGSLMELAAAVANVENLLAHNVYVRMMRDLLVDHRVLHRLSHFCQDYPHLNEQLEDKSTASSVIKKPFVTRRAGLMGYARLWSNLFHMLLNQKSTGVSTDPGEMQEAFTCEPNFLSLVPANNGLTQEEDPMDENKLAVIDFNFTSMHLDEILMSAPDELKDILSSEIPESCLEDWFNFAKSYLSRLNMDCFVDYGHFPTAICDEDDEAGVDELDPFGARDAGLGDSRSSSSTSSVSKEAQKLYEAYCCQGLNVSFPDQFGLGEEEFNAVSIRTDILVEHQLRSLSFCADQHLLDSSGGGAADFEATCNELLTYKEGVEVASEFPLMFEQPLATSPHAQTAKQQDLDEEAVERSPPSPTNNSATLMLTWGASCSEDDLDDQRTMDDRSESRDKHANCSSADRQTTARTRRKKLRKVFKEVLNGPSMPTQTAAANPFFEERPIDDLEFERGDKVLRQLRRSFERLNLAHLTGSSEQKLEPASRPNRRVSMPTWMGTGDDLEHEHEEEEEEEAKPQFVIPEPPPMPCEERQTNGRGDSEEPRPPKIQPRQSSLLLTKKATSKLTLNMSHVGRKISDPTPAAATYANTFQPLYVHEEPGEDFLMPPLLRPTPITMFDQPPPPANTNSQHHNKQSKFSSRTVLKMSNK